jgi:hypothetical protein
MIPRHQKFLFGILLLASVGMGVLLWQLRERADRILRRPALQRLHRRKRRP